MIQDRHQATVMVLEDFETRLGSEATAGSCPGCAHLTTISPTPNLRSLPTALRARFLLGSLEWIDRAGIRICISDATILRWLVTEFHLLRWECDHPCLRRGRRRSRPFRELGVVRGDSGSCSPRSPRGWRASRGNVWAHKTSELCLYVQIREDVRSKDAGHRLRARPAEPFVLTIWQPDDR